MVTDCDPDCSCQYSTCGSDQYLKIPLRHTHYSGPLVSFVPFSVQCLTHWVSIRCWMKTQWGGNSLAYLVHTIQHQYLHWLETAVQCCVPEAVFWAEEDFGLSVCTSHHYLVQFGVPQAADHTLRRAGENSITQEVTTLTDTTDSNRVKHLEWMVIWALACYSSCVI